MITVSNLLCVQIPTKKIPEAQNTGFQDTHKRLVTCWNAVYAIQLHILVFSLLFTFHLYCSIFIYPISYICIFYLLFCIGFFLLQIYLIYSYIFIIYQNLKIYIITHINVTN